MKNVFISIKIYNITSNSERCVLNKHNYENFAKDNSLGSTVFAFFDTGPAV